LLASKEIDESLGNEFRLFERTEMTGPGQNEQAGLLDAVRDFLGERCRSWSSSPTITKVGHLMLPRVARDTGRCIDAFKWATKVSAPHSAAMLR
jgi:hypothetical protein